MHFGINHNNNSQDTSPHSHFSHRLSQPLFARHTNRPPVVDSPPSSSSSSSSSSSTPLDGTWYGYGYISMIGTTMLSRNRNSNPESITRSSRRHIRPHGLSRNNQDSMTQSPTISTTGVGATRDHVSRTSLGRGFKKMKSMLMIKSGPSYPNEPSIFDTAIQTNYHSLYQPPDQSSSSSTSRYSQRLSTPESAATVMPGAYTLRPEMLSENMRFVERPQGPFQQTTSWLPQLDFDPPFGGAAARAAAHNANQRIKMERKDSNLANPPAERGYGRENRESGIIMSAEHSRVGNSRSRRESRVEGRSKALI